MIKLHPYLSLFPKSDELIFVEESEFQIQLKTIFESNSFF